MSILSQPIGKSNEAPKSPPRVRTCEVVGSVASFYIFDYHSHILSACPFLGYKLLDAAESAARQTVTSNFINLNYSE